MFKKFFECTLVFILVVELVVSSLLILSIKTELPVEILLNRFQTMEYRGAILKWQSGYPMPEERLEVFYRVVDTLVDDIQPKYRIGEFPMTVYYLGFPDFYAKIAKCSESVGMQRGKYIYLSPELVEGDIDNGFFAMALVHEYVHVIQHFSPDYLEQYALDVGWVQEGGSYIPNKENSSFLMVLSNYSLRNEKEDMAETFMYSYLCGNNLERLSETRLEYVSEFWGVPRDQYCQNFD